MSAVTASKALQRISKDLSISPTQDGKSELAAISNDERPVLAIREVEDIGLPTCKDSDRDRDKDILR